MYMGFLKSCLTLRMSMLSVAQALLFAIILIMSITVKAQISATITGMVHDSSGAVISGVQVILKNGNTGEERKSLANAEGYYAFAAVQSGKYSIKLNKEGFKPSEIRDITVNPGDKRNFNVVLEVGAITSDTIVVSSGGDSVPVDSGERSAVLNNKQIQNLSLIGRDATELLKILPGMAVYSGGGVGNGMGFDPTVSGFVGAVGNGIASNGGVHRGGTDLVMDGAHIIDPGCNCSSTAMVNADMVAEVKVQTSNFGADSAKGPVVVNAVSKSGTQDYHGQAYLYARDSFFNSNTWDGNRSQFEKPNDRYMYPGFNVSGPLKIPGTKFNKEKKIVFWAGYEYYYQRVPATTLRAYVPTVGMRNGDFTMNGEGNAALCPNGFSASSWPPMCATPIGVAQNGTTIANGIISANQMDAGGKAIMSMIPLPNANPLTNNGYNYVQQLITNQNGSIFKTRWDYNLSDNTKFYVNYQNQRQTDEVPVHIWWIPSFSAALPGGGLESRDKSHTISGTFVHTFSPVMTNEAVFSLGYIDFPLRIKKPQSLARANYNYPYKGVYNNKSLRMPALSNGYWVPGYPQLDQPDFFSEDGTYIWEKIIPSFQNNLTRVVGTHSIKLGFFTESTANNQGAWGYLNGQTYFSPFGPFVTNTHPEGLGTYNPVANMLLGVVSGYNEVNFNAANKMSYRTISWYAQDSWKVLPRLTLDLGFRFDRSAPWRDSDNKSGIAIWNDAQYQTDVASGRELPGIRYMGVDSSIPNGGYPTRWAYVSPRLGAAYDLFGTGNTVLRGGWGAYRWHEPNVVADALSTAIGTRSYSIPNAMYLSEIDDLAGKVTGSFSSGASAIRKDDDERPVTYSYNFTLSQRLPWKSLLEVAYVGNNSKNLILGSGNRNINTIARGALFNPDPVTGAPSNPTGANLANYRAYRAYGNNSVPVTGHLGYANYNALQTSWSKQSGRLTYNLNYTWSKSLGIRDAGNGSFDSLNYENNYGVLNIDRSHVFNTSYMFEFGKPYGGPNKFIGGAMNGWAVSGITTWQSGGNLAALANSGFNMTSVTGSSETLSNVTWLGTPDVSLQPVLLCDPTKNLKDGQFINGACFGVSPKGTNGSMSLPYIHAPAYFNSDLMLSKQFNITERQSIQFKFTANNWLNHSLTSFNPSGTENLTLRFRKDSSGNWMQANETFGHADFKMGRRVVQFSLKYSF